MRKRLYKRGIAYVLITILTVVSAGCGKRKADFDDYGAATESTEQKSSEENSEQETSEQKVDISEASTIGEGKLSEKLGGTQFNYAKDFTLGGNPAGINIEYTVTDSDRMPTYKVSEITEKDVHEDEMVEKVFGGTGEALNKDERSELSVDQGDSEYIINAYKNVLFDNEEDFDPESEKCKPWLEKDDYYIHIYEGTHNGIEYQFMVSYNKKRHEKSIVLYPKSYGEISGNLDMDSMGFTDQSGKFFAYDETKGNTSAIDTKTVMADRPNKCTLTDEEIVDCVVKPMHDDYFVDIPGNEIVFATSMFLGYHIIGEYAEEGRSEILYYNEDILSDSNLPGAVLDGYCVSFYNTLGNQKVITPSLKQDIGDAEAIGSQFFINNAGLFGFSVCTQYNYEEELSDNVPIMKFDEAMKKFEEEMIKNVDVSQTNITTSKVEFVWLELLYYPIEDGNGKYDLIPAWVGFVEGGGSLKIIGIISAIDGQFLNVYYP